MDELISVTDISKVFRSGKAETHAVRGVSFDIYKGQSIAITGASGCGKTTLLNMLGLVITPSSGSIFIEGEDISKFPDRQRARYRNHYFGYIYQEFALIESYTVYDNIEIPLLYAKRKLKAADRRKRIIAAIESVGLTVKGNDRVRNLSGGQRQRVAIARAMINQPQIILADEPTGALDTQTGATIMALLKQYVSTGKTLVLVTHDNALAGQCDRRFTMRDGQFDH